MSNRVAPPPALLHAPHPLNHEDPGLDPQVVRRIAWHRELRARRPLARAASCDQAFDEPLHLITISQNQPQTAYNL